MYAYVTSASDHSSFVSDHLSDYNVCLSDCSDRLSDASEHSSNTFERSSDYSECSSDTFDHLSDASDCMSDVFEHLSDGSDCLSECSECSSDVFDRLSSVIVHKSSDIYQHMCFKYKSPESCDSGLYTSVGLLSFYGCLLSDDFH